MKKIAILLLFLALLTNSSPALGPGSLPRYLELADDKLKQSRSAVMNSYEHAPFVQVPVDTSGRPLLIEHEKTGMLMVLVPEGKFLIGDREEMQGKCKPFELDVPAYYVALHPVTNRQYEKFVTEGHYPAPEIADTGNVVWKKGAYPEEKAEHPVTFVTWHNAAAYCDWAGLRLPRDFEWEKAARWTDGRTFPWGDEWDPDKCRNRDNQGWKKTARVWDYAAGASAFGAYQMCGNVTEWCADRYEHKPHTRYKKGDLKPPKKGECRVVRGGWFDMEGPETFTTSERYAGTPGLRYDYRSFRCVADIVDDDHLQSEVWISPGFSSVFDKWFEMGRQLEVSSLSERTLLRRIEASDPPEAIPILAALASRGTATQMIRERVAQSDHWLIRLAGLVTGLVQTEAAKDSNLWVREMAR